jgi:hypothetical protein
MYLLRRKQLHATIRAVADIDDAIVHATTLDQADCCARHRGLKDSAATFASASRAPDNGGPPPAATASARRLHQRQRLPHALNALSVSNTITRRFLSIRGVNLVLLESTNKSPGLFTLWGPISEAGATPADLKDKLALVGELEQHVVGIRGSNYWGCYR